MSKVIENIKVQNIEELKDLDIDLSDIFIYEKLLFKYSDSDYFKAFYSKVNNIDFVKSAIVKTIGMHKYELANALLSIFSFSEKDLNIFINESIKTYALSMIGTLVDCVTEIDPQIMLNATILLKPKFLNMIVDKVDESKITSEIFTNCVNYAILYNKPEALDILFKLKFTGDIKLDISLITVALEQRNIPVLNRIIPRSTSFLTPSLIKTAILTENITIIKLFIKSGADLSFNDYEVIKLAELYMDEEIHEYLKRLV